MKKDEVFYYNKVLIQENEMLRKWVIDLLKKIEELKK